MVPVILARAREDGAGFCSCRRVGIPARSLD
jgi:hypothetical protein